MELRGARIAIWLAAACVLIALGIWALLPLFVSSDVVRAAIERELTEITGQPVSVNGPVDVDLFPSPTAQLHDLRISTDGSLSQNAREFLVVDTVEVAIPLSSLMARRPTFTQFRMLRPVLHFAIGADGHLDTGPIGGRLGGAIALQNSEQAAGSDTVPNSTEHTRLGTLTIVDGTIEFSDPSSETPERITSIAGVVSWPRMNERLTATLNGIWRGTAFEQKTEIDAPIQFFSNSIAGVRLNLTSDALSYGFNGKMSVGQAPFVEGSVSLSTPSLRRALDWLRVDIAPGRAIGDLQLKATIRGDEKKARFENLEMVLQGNSGMGVLEFALKSGAKPAMTATLDFADLDILSFLSAFTGFPRTVAAIEEPVSTTFIDQLDVDLRLSATHARAGALQLTDVAAVTQIGNGNAVFEIADATAYGGRAQSRFRIGRGESGLTSDLNVAFENISTGTIADSLALTGLIPRGQSSGAFTVSSPVEKWSDLFKRASGKVQMNVINGSIIGVGFKKLSGPQGEQRFFRLQENPQSSGVFSAMNLDAIVQEGVIIIDKGVIAYPEGSIELSGVIPYGTASIALTTIARPNPAAVESATPVIQHFIGGSWNNPYATPVLVPQLDP